MSIARRLLPWVLLAAHGAAQAQEKSDWERERAERDWRESAFTLPAYPSPESLVPFFVSSASSFSFFIDGATLSATEDGVVRYVLVARSAQGSESVSFEGIRCSKGEYRIYATGQSDRSWTPSRSAWRPIQPGSVQRWHQALYKEYFCPLGNPINSAAEGLEALRRGGHPRRARTGD